MIKFWLFYVDFSRVVISLYTEEYSVGRRTWSWRCSRWAPRCTPSAWAGRGAAAWAPWSSLPVGSGFHASGKGNCPEKKSAQDWTIECITLASEAFPWSSRCFMEMGAGEYLPSRVHGRLLSFASKVSTRINFTQTMQLVIQGAFFDWSRPKKF